MELFEYIKSQLPHLPNPAIMKNLGASEELIGYVRETVWNTNLNVIGSLSSGGGGDQGEVWATLVSGNPVIVITSEEVVIGGEASTNKSYNEWLDIFNNHDAYSITFKFSDRGVEAYYATDGYWEVSGGSTGIAYDEVIGEIEIDAANITELPLEIIITHK